ncbi:MAG: orotidine-5'-phosphate decarboxylase [Negativicutes bacterium]|nr:orotidine-5'-phosphate decarboxylase [Negativicutes bacterium]
MKADKRLIVALDVPGLGEMKALVTKLGDAVQYYKVGMELFYGAGAEAIQFLRGQGKEVFLDLKMHDIPNTVAQSAKVLTGLGASMFNIHAIGGTAMMAATAAAVRETAETLQVDRPKLIAVTVLTSMDAAEWSRLGYQVPIGEQALHLAKLARQAGLDGVVASPQEAPQIRRECGPEFLIVTPGVRPAGSAANDQSRTATPAGALAAGASHLVIGRPITAASDPQAAAVAIIREMEGN